ncbi:DUF6283 family protein [Nocardia takedensis]|uniref:DUF6283 family protein n=1 Tax=Nocardia takedensis TaxID=259390 RepID=UPI000316BA8D|nr:DUF6283 family protein [Nocardia takedensis]
MTTHDGHTEHMGPPAPRPCTSCPYRRDVPSGIWDHTEYRKLRAYDNDLPDQPAALFQCHQQDADDDRRRMCAGWVGCHGPTLFALRLALVEDRITPTTYRAVTEYHCPTPLFTTGAAAADHGETDLHDPTAEAAHAIAKIRRARTDLADHATPLD